MKRLALALLLIVACADDLTPRQSKDVQWIYIGLSNDIAHITIDGIDCVVADGGRGTVAIDCDWPER